MTIISENQKVTADVCVEAGGLSICFADDPSYIRSETVLVDLMHRSIGIIFQNAYHHIGDLPKNLAGKDVETMTSARLSGHGQEGRAIELHAPIKIVQNA